jgi:hypothetical protein
VLLYEDHSEVLGVPFRNQREKEAVYEIVARRAEQSKPEAVVLLNDAYGIFCFGDSGELLPIPNSEELLNDYQHGSFQERFRAGDPNVGEAIVAYVSPREGLDWTITQPYRRGRSNRIEFAKLVDTFSEQRDINAMQNLLPRWKAAKS